jgi:parallel beta-helix repeat protein
MRTIFRIIIVLACLASGSVFAANKYVRAGAAGANNGSDWTNAYASLPATLVRGDTYYVASGSYGAYNFDDPLSGGLIITVKKATAADHGTDVGWQAAYGSGQAVFNSIIRFSRGNYVFDGQTRNESDWFDKGSYGFRINHNGQNQNIVIDHNGVPIDNIAVKNVYVDAIYGNLDGPTVRRYAVDTDGYAVSGAQATNLLFHKMFVYGSNNVWFLRTTTGAIVEYSASDGALNGVENHGEIVNLYYTGYDAVIRYNIFRNAYVDNGARNGGTALVAITYAGGLQFYGNVAQNFATGDGAVGFSLYYSSGNRVHNNTFINGIGWNSGVSWGSGSDNLVYNNLWVNCGTVNLQGTHDYNAFSDSNARGEPNAQTNVSVSALKDVGGGKYVMTAESRPGVSLAAPFNRDMLGLVRGSDGVVTRGAFEFNAAGAAVLGAPTGLVVR